MNWAFLFEAELNCLKPNKFDREDRECTDLSGAELNGAYLVDAKLNGAILVAADLNGAFLWRAQMNGANLRSAKLNCLDRIVDNRMFRDWAYSPG